jgi:hypothetical protein
MSKDSARHSHQRRWGSEELKEEDIPVVREELTSIIAGINHFAAVKGKRFEGFEDVEVLRDAAMKMLARVTQFFELCLQHNDHLYDVKVRR